MLSTAPLHNIQLWKAEVIDPSTEEGRIRFAILKSNGIIHCENDTLENQVAELAIIRNPSLKDNPMGLANAISATIGEKNWDTYGRWIVFPWNGNAVRLLPPESFIEVRTNRNRDRITKEEQDLLSEKTVGIVGLSVGQSTAVAIAMERSAGTIRIADFDDLELSNLNRIRAGVHELGLPKWLIAARTIAETDPYIKVEVFPEGIQEENVDRFMYQCDVVIDACDGLSAKAMIRLEALERKIPVIMDTSDRGMLDIERYDILNFTDGFLHGRIDAEKMASLRNKSNWDTETLNLFIDFSSASERGQISLAQMGTKLVGWPQLYSDVSSGSAFAAEAARRLMLGEDLPDSRLYLEIDEQLSVKN
jgi:molybdopterin/thiamine biosynthesis adenylyltransferase